MNAQGIMTAMGINGRDNDRQGISEAQLVVN